ncbi:snRNA-activating protein complex subunit 1 isoform X2 [Hylobates moloch]|uniref:snRNA-activating protein complex subunit 1 isoform X2 n=1 Tax=Symphalangus syndactylus TaxID=9590 RepID=UPI002440FDD3|nr:snRNA-activating protein complex subunit 1 isoform X2 [Symphalangus syndactylus]XP_058285783.1 snRNA-activating protein complex subunit 1 isoform X2 [Hylobates moloch]
MGTPPGLQTDCEALLSRFQEMDSVRFEDFTELWRNMKFGTIFCGRMRNLEKNMFTKEALALAWRYFLPPYTFQIRVGALYLLYGLYNTQLCQPKQKIRVALKDWDEVLKFQQDLVNAQHFDAAYIFRKLRLDRAFHFTAMPKLLSYRMKKKIHRAEVTEEFKDPSDRVMKLITSDVLENPSLKSKTNDGEEKMEGNSQETERCERAESLAKIKSKAFSVVIQASKSRRHRQVKLDSSDSDSASGQGQVKATRAKEKKERLKPAGRKMSFRNKGNVQNIHKEDKPLSLSMPVITEEEENESLSGTEFTASKKRRKH